MDKRKQQLQRQIDAINEEAKIVQLNFDKIIGQVYLCIDLVNNSKKFNNKDCASILKYELKVLKKLIDFNFELDSIADESPLKELQTANVTETSIELKLIKSEDSTEAVGNEILLKNETQTSEVLQKLEFSTNTVQTDNNLSANEIQTLRDTLKKFSEKLNRDKEQLTSTSNSNLKPTNFEEKLNGESLGVQTVSDCETKLILNAETASETDKFGVPEKYLNELAVTLPLRGRVVEGEDVETDDAESSFSESFEVIPDDKDKNYEMKTFHKGIWKISDDFIKEDGTASNYNIFKVPSCDMTRVIPLENDEEVEEEEEKEVTEVEGRDKKIMYTALQKLTMKRVDEKIEDESQKNLADIKLQPTEYRMMNNLQSNSKQSKKKNKKGKSKQEELYELVPKAAPEVNMDCAFSHVESPDEFYIHIVDEESKNLDTLTEMLNHMFNGTVTEYSSKLEAWQNLGDFCICYSSYYKAWYRVQVVDWKMNSKTDELEVQFVDYGNRKYVSYKNLRKMIKEIASIPMLAIRCHMALMYPPYSTAAKKLTVWPTATIDAMMELSGLLDTADFNMKIFRIVFASRDENSVAIDMYNLKEQNIEQTVGQILLDLGLAIQIIEEFDENETDIEEFLQDVNCLETADNINEAVMGYDPKDEARICRFTKNDGTCFKGKNCKLEHVPLSKDGFTTDTVEAYVGATKPLVLPKKNEIAHILITGYKDICSFYAQIICKPHQEKGHMVDVALYTLQREMNTEEIVCTYQKYDKISPSVGEIVLAKHWSRNWLRAVVRDEQWLDNGDIKVFALDFGDYITVKPSELRKMKVQFLDLPFQAVECYLSGYAPNEDYDKDMSKHFFYQNIYYRNFTVKVLSSSLPLKVTATTFDARNIGEMLTAQGCAKVMASDVNPEDCLLEIY